MGTPFQLGQIVYVLSNKTQSVVPAIIAEENRRLNGSSYKVSIGPIGKQKIVDLDKIDGEVFVSLDDIRLTLIERLTSFVDDLVASTEKRTREWYQQNTSSSSTDVKSSVDGKIDPQTLLAEANNSVPVMPQSKSKTQSSVVNPTSPNGLREHLRTMLSSPAETLEEETVLTLEDGTQKKVKINFNGQ